MIFHDTQLADAILIETPPFKDDRGSFRRTYCQSEFADHGLPVDWVQQNLSTTSQSGSIRGMHFQIGASQEDKLVRCLQGSIFDVIVDIRQDSATFMKWQGFELSATNEKQLLVPKGFAHGFQTLEPNCVVSYLVSSPYDPGAERGLRHDDPAIAIQWPLMATEISEKDRNWPLLTDSSASNL